MPSETYELFEQAMRERSQIVCRYHGLVREICPIILGWTDEEEKCLSYQFGGESTKPMTTPQSRRRCFSLPEVSDVVLREGPRACGHRAQPGADLRAPRRHRCESAKSL